MGRRSRPRYPIYTREQLIQSFDFAIAGFVEVVAELERETEQQKRALAILQDHRNKLTNR